MSAYKNLPIVWLVENIAHPCFDKNIMRQELLNLSKSHRVQIDIRESNTTDTWRIAVKGESKTANEWQFRSLLHKAINRAELLYMPVPIEVND